MNGTFADTFFYLALLNPKDAARERALTINSGHPDQCIVTFSAIHVALPKSQAPYATGVAKYALVHVNRLEPIVLEESK